MIVGWCEKESGGQKEIAPTGQPLFQKTAEPIKGTVPI
jgi:hypothetical protein